MNRLLFIAFILSNVLTAQVKISGKVVTADHTPVAFAEVLLFANGPLPVKNQITNEKGEFVLEYKAGSYKLKISQFGTILYTKDIELSSDLDLGEILTNNVQELQAVVITQKKEIVERKVDRLVFNIENTISTAGGDALDALKITPGVQIQNESITIAGKSTVRVLLDDKMIELGQEELTNLLKSIPAENIKSIEVITTPPAKYEALGNSGLVNIRLKKAKKDSWNLSLGTGYLQRHHDPEGSTTSNFIYNKNKLSMSASLNYRDGGIYLEQESKIHFADGLWVLNYPLQKKHKMLNGIVSMQYIATPKWVLGFQYLTNLNKTDTDATRSLLIYDNDTNEVTQNITSVGYAFLRPTLHSVNVFNEYKLNPAGGKMLVNVDYFKYKSNDSRPYEGTSEEYNPPKKEFFKGINNNNQNISNFSGKVDFELPVEWANIGFGGKVSFSDTKNLISTFNSDFTDQPVTDLPLEDFDFGYKENVQAVYISGNKKFANNLESQVGLRFENTQAKSYEADVQQSVNNNYNRLFPSFNISYTPQPHSVYRLSYSKRIDRPTFAQLNPNIAYINPFQSIQGNPLLQPAFIDNFEFIYSYKKLESKLYYSHDKNVFMQISTPDPDTNIVRIVTRNIFNMERYGISEIYVFNEFKWWTSNNTADFNYTKSRSLIESTKGIEGYNLKLATNNDFILNDKKTLLLNLNYWYVFPKTEGFVKLDASSSTAVTLQYLLNDNLRISLKANDIFRTEKINFNPTVNGVYQEYRLYNDSRYIQLYLNYRLGSKKAKIINRNTGNEEERKRVGG
ncbi:TonB-dependent receptor [Flavobacterium cupreum]|uniref:TonB-dependent receptor n=1 Tax=Flavobacterium cupreum TaxID=2133766 RepID=A0A434A5F0_9FLAO|nr:TonB-dependent receptor [Flavobacterium cupreum]RUT69555.1 TonB-dependent receptor [Flavobacterium cupreum]